MRSRGVVPVALALVMAPMIVAPTRTSACGHCIEDKVAATYDYAVLMRAARDGHVVVFTEIRGPAAGAGPELKEFITRTLAALPGVDAGTVRVSLEPPAASFACDPARHAPGTLVGTVNPRLAAKALSLAIIEIDRSPRRK